MLIDARDLEDGHLLEADVVVIGGGAAGITLACELAGSGVGVAVLESGGTDPEVRIQELNRGESVGLATPPLDSSRLRYLGGTTGHWNGQCAPLDPLDFEVRDWVPHSGWPFDRAFLDAFYARATEYCQLGAMELFDARGARSALGASPLGLDETLLEPLAYQVSPPTRFGSAWRPRLEEALDVGVYLYANAVEVELSEDGGSVAGVRCATDGDRRIRARGSAYVLAAGGIENPRILLASRSVRPAGVGNEHDVVGRYFMDHFNVVGAGELVFGEPERVDGRFLGFWQLDGAPGRGGFRVPDRRAREERLLNAGILFHPVPLDHVEETEGVDAFVDLVRSAAARDMPDDLGGQACLALEDRREVLAFIGRRLRRAVGPPVGTQAASLQMEAEPLPNPESRVTLSRDTDRYGVPRPRLDWRSSPQDVDSIRRTLAIFARAVGAAGLGRHRAEFSLTDGEPTLATAYHHMGATRMGTDPRTSVVDPSCRVHGIANLYVAGSSVFPTAGRSNPTLTLVALAIRLADHLRGGGRA